MSLWRRRVTTIHVLARTEARLRARAGGWRDARGKFDRIVLEMNDIPYVVLRRLRAGDATSRRVEALVERALLS